MRLSSFVKLGLLLIVVALVIKMDLLLFLGVLLLLVPLVLGAVRLIGRYPGEPSGAGAATGFGNGRSWWPRADAMLKQQISWLQEGRFATAQLQGFPFDAAYVRRAQKIAGSGYTVTLTTSDLMPNEPAILVVPRN